MGIVRLSTNISRMELMKGTHCLGGQKSAPLAGRIVVAIPGLELDGLVPRVPVRAAVRTWCELNCRQRMTK